MPGMDQNESFLQGISQYKNKNYLDALTTFLALSAEENVDEAEILYYLGICYARLDRYEEAIMYLEQVVTAETDDADKVQKARFQQCRYLLAIAYTKTGRVSLAEYEMKKLDESGYKSSSFYATLAYLEWQRGNVDSCIENYHKALQLDENNPTALNGLGYVLAETGSNYTQALNYCKKALSLTEDSAACLDSLGWVYCKMGFSSDGLRYLNQAAKKDRDNKIIAEHIKQAEMVQ